MIVAAWHGAYYKRVPPKDFPKLGDVLDRLEGRAPRRMTPDEMLAQIEAFNIKAQGADLRPRKEQADG